MTRALDHAERSPPAGVYGGSLARLSCHSAARPEPQALARWKAAIATGLDQTLAASKLKLEEKANEAADHIKGVVVRVSAVAALAVAAAIFALHRSCAARRGAARHQGHRSAFWQTAFAMVRQSAGRRRVWPRSRNCSCHRRPTARSRLASQMCAFRTAASPAPAAGRAVPRLVVADRDAGGGRDYALFLHCSLRITLGCFLYCDQRALSRRPARQ